MDHALGPICEHFIDGEHSIPVHYSKVLQRALFLVQLTNRLLLRTLVRIDQRLCQFDLFIFLTIYCHRLPNQINALHVSYRLHQLFDGLALVDRHLDQDGLFALRLLLSKLFGLLEQVLALVSLDGRHLV